MVVHARHLGERGADCDASALAPQLVVLCALPVGLAAVDVLAVVQVARAHQAGATAAATEEADVRRAGGQTGGRGAWA